MKFNNSKRLQEGVMSRGIQLSESSKWKGYTNAIREGYKEKNGKSIPDNIVSTTAILLENTYNYCARMDETTRVVNLGNFVDYGFEVISAVVPNLISHELVSVQPMNAKFGAIFYLQYLYGNDKGSIKKNDIMRSPFTGSAGNQSFTGEAVEGESLGTGDGSKTDFNSVTLAYSPVRSRSAVITVGGGIKGPETFKDPVTGEFKILNTNASDVLTVVNTVVNEKGETIDTLSNLAGTSTATLNVSTGVVSDIHFAVPPADGAAIQLDYDYNMDLTENGFSQVDLDLQSVSIEAKPRKIRARWLLDAAYELEKTKGIDAESELVIALSSEIKHEIDNEVLTRLYAQAAHTGYEWDCQLPAASGVSYVDYKRTIIDVLTEMSNKIFTSTKRIGANFIVGGVNFCTIIETLPEFESAGLAGGQVNGPHFIGTLAGKWRVYKNPFYQDDVFLMGYKGSSYLDAGFVYAPYMPLYATPTQVMDDFIFRKGLATSYGQLMLNNKLYAKGTIKNFTPTRMINASPITIKNA